jgi:aminomethyltransferase
VIGVITSGGFGPTVNGPVAQGYVDTTYAKAARR